MLNITKILSLGIVIVLAHLLGRRSKVPLPFILIGLGMLFSGFPLYLNLTFNPDLFTFLIIAPLMYIEAKGASRYWIGR
ncbi:NhaP-type Na+/H+ or K+/H+ antiporter [Weissella beninensis]|uniref:Uncharacterized protein n=1 Tax=Periweissella beninensis TaxID=504936 RepID=A0ABT0VHA3_9LACO|nr:hypothetical protein [Periweissella beninensis]MBM7544980.1 NhaP-type Na+/H+ or K+/H+ antiporter [Periweissella beninensis]MCM2437222.1 hypothetical protein [Periweissella beninensis]